MKPVITQFVIMALLLQLGQAFAQGLDKYYTRKVQENGDIFFVFPNDDFNNKTNRTAFLFDITYRQGNDSATINFTYYTPEPDPANSLIVKSSATRCVLPTEKIYIDFAKKSWIQRYAAKISFGELRTLFKPDSPIAFKVVAAHQTYHCMTKDKKWHNYAEAVTRIIYIIESD